VDTPLSLRCELTAERLDRAAPELAAALALWTVRHQEALRATRERLEPVVRWFGVALSVAGALLSGWAVATFPETTCRGPAPTAFYQLATPLFVLFGVVFWFLPRLSAALRAWAPGAAARRAPRLLATLRPHLPSEVSYQLAGGRLAASLARPRRQSVTPLAAVRGAVAGRTILCLFGPPPLSRLRRVVWLAGEPERQALLAALGEAGVPVQELPAPAGEPGPATHP
jgi:hypothetical protein